MPFSLNPLAAFQKPLLQTRLEFLCQNTGTTFQVNVHQNHKSFTCRFCSQETFIVTLGAGRGNVSVKYIHGAGVERVLEPVIPDPHKPAKNSLAQYTDTGGTFVVVKQEEL